MSVLDHLNQIQNGWQIALLVGIGCVVLLFVIGIPLSCVIKNNNKLDALFTAITILFVLFAVDIFASIAGLLISSSQVSQTCYFADKYDIEQMADDYDARVIEDNKEHNPYLVCYEGYGTEEWVYYVGKPNPQAQYLIQKDG